jgi:carboxyl-terminal processing protease
MNKSRILFLLLSLAVLLPVVSGSLSRAATDQSGDRDSLSKHLSVFSEVLSLIRRAYVEETSIENLLAGALDGATEALDPLATYVPAAEVDSYRLVRQLGRAHSGLTVAKEGGIAFVVAVDEGSPGATAGLQQGDILAKLNDLSTRRMPLWQLQSVLAEEPGTELRLEVLRRGRTLEPTLVLGSYKSRPPYLDEVEGVATLRLARFVTGDLDLLRARLAQLVAEQRGELLIDVRGIAGGEAEAAYSMAGLFVEGSLGELRSREGATIQFESREQPLWRGRTVVLVDGGTQGAAEVFAAVMSQLGGARLVGLRSFGHAGRQRLVPLADGSQLLLTDAFYRGPDGGALDESLVPDVLVTELARRVDEEDLSLEDLILRRGLELLRVPEEEPREEVA